MKTPLQDNAIPLFDLHCDTLSKIYRQNLNFDCSDLHISLSKAKHFSPYIQICAIWCNNHLNDDEAYISFKQNTEYIKAQDIQLSTSVNDRHSPTFLLSVEDARLLNNDINRLAVLYDNNVRLLTLNWHGESCIGGGWDTDAGLSKFGHEVVKKCHEKGIIIDLSHSSVAVQKDVLHLADKLGFSPVFTHSNSYSVCNHNRNLADDVFKEVISLGGIVGISLCPEHLEEAKAATVHSVVKHIYHYLSLNGENHIALGCDLDGVDSLPMGIKSIKDLCSVYELIKNELGRELANKIFFKNAYNYFIKKLV